MTPKEKYNEEKDELKNARMNRILSAAFELFSVKGIDNVAMTDIAKQAEIGVASLYRYYETKDEIAIRTAIWAWENQRQDSEPNYENEEFNKANGLQQIEKEFKIFINLLDKENAFLRFIYFFDSYAVRTEISKERLIDYEAMISRVQKFVVASIEKGIEDGSIKQEYKGSEVQLYFTLSHCMFSSAQKLSLSGNMLKMDSIVNGKKELESLLKILIDGIKN